MNKILIVNYKLSIGGAERLVYELVDFALQNNIEPVVLIPDNYAIEYYDQLFRQMNVTVVRTRLRGIRGLRNPKRIIKALLWRIKVQYLAKEFSAVHIINLDLADRIGGLIVHPRRYMWHIGNSIQYKNSTMPFRPGVFENPADTLIYINDYQRYEIEQQYGKVKCKEMDFKLFIN